MSKAEMKRLIGMSLLILLLFFAHVYYNLAVAYYLFEKTGGVHKEVNGWTRFGGIDYAWTTPLYVPGCMIIDLGRRLHAGQPYSTIGGFLLLCASAASSWALAHVVLAAVLHRKQLLGARYYRLILAAAGWIWVLVPVQWTWVYQWTVIY